MYSQTDEEKHIVEYFGDFKGRFLDIGAADGVTFSNTRRLVELGWSGVMVEPSPYMFVKLMNNTPRGIDLVNAGVGLESGVTLFHACNDFLSTFDEDHRELWATRDKVDFRPMYAQVLTAEQLFNAFPGPYHFINIDVEGTNYELLPQIPLNTLGCKCLCVEYEDQEAGVMEHCQKLGFKRLHKTVENLIFVREE